MKNNIALITLGLAVAVPGVAMAREVTLTTTLKSYSGNPAYVVLYVTDASGKYDSTLWMAGGRTKYYRHLTDWRRASGNAQIDGITGASVGSGETMTVKAEIADALIDAGYVIHIDSAVEGQMENPSEVVLPLTAAGSGKPASGSGYIDSFQYDM